MDFRLVNIAFQAVVFLFAISVHEAAHAWMAHRMGDSTAYMLGRVTLNPLKHIDPIGTIIMPLLAAFTGVPLIGWARPTPVNTRNFRKIIQGDVMTTLAGPVSNLVVAGVAVALLGVIAKVNPMGRNMVHCITQQMLVEPQSVLMPIVFLLYTAVILNVLLFIFNLFPVPPLDGSHIFRYFLPLRLQATYDRMGMIGLVVLFLFAGSFIRFFFVPTMGFLNSLILGF